MAGLPPNQTLTTNQLFFRGLGDGSLSIRIPVHIFSIVVPLLKGHLVCKEIVVIIRGAMFGERKYFCPHYEIWLLCYNILALLPGHGLVGALFLPCLNVSLINFNLTVQ